MGIEETKNPSDVKLSTVYYKGGANLNINIKHNVQIFGGVGYYITGDGKNESGVNLGSWDKDVFPGRSGMAIVAGLKIGF